MPSSVCARKYLVAGLFAFFRNSDLSSWSASSRSEAVPGAASAAISQSAPRAPHHTGSAFVLSRNSVSVPNLILPRLGERGRPRRKEGGRRGAEHSHGGKEMTRSQPWREVNEHGRRQSRLPFSR